ncbi:MAG: TIGR00282 family metallophosphoesterase [Dehalococcoidia bacterium]
MRILMVGDIIGKPGRRAVQTLLPDLRKEYEIDLVIANAENAAGGYGLTLETSQELLMAGVDVITTGNHVYDQKEIIPYLDGELPILRPINFPTNNPGEGYLTKDNVMVVNLIGRVFMKPVDCPFRTMDDLLSAARERPPVVIVDFHSEATSEAGAMGWYLDGRVSSVLGTHTHVGTVDTQILPKGTAYLTDVGMVGPRLSVIGDDPEAVIQRFITMMHHRLSVAKGPVRFSSVLVEVEDHKGKATSIQRIDREVE